MNIDLLEVGLILITLAWLVQLGFMLRKDRKIQKAFVGLYVVGVALLAVNAFLSGSLSHALLQTVSMAAALLVLFVLLGKKG